MEQELVERAGLSFYGIETGKLHGMDAKTIFTSLGKMTSGVRQSLRLLRNFQPHVCFVTGASQGVAEAVRADAGLAKGVNLSRGKITCRAVADAHGLRFDPLM